MKKTSVCVWMAPIHRTVEQESNLYLPRKVSEEEK